MKKYINVGFMAIFTLMTFVLSFSSCSSEDDDIMSEYPPEEKPEVPHYDNLSYMPGANVQLINKAEYCKSIIADGKELIIGNESGVITVPELKDPKVYITFKEGITDFSDVFLGCTKLTSVPANLFANHPNATSFSGAFFGCMSLKSIPAGLFANNRKVTDFYSTFFGCTSLAAIPEKLFANNPEVTNFSLTFHGCSALTTIPENLFANNSAVTTFSETFYGCTALIAIPENLFANNLAVTSFNFTFYGCKALTSIPANLFDNNRKVTDFAYTFYGCKALTGESPYTMIDGQKVHLYERANYPEQFTAPENSDRCFYGCTGLTDYSQIPTDWL